MFNLDMFDGYTPKRGDLIHTNLGTSRERTWFVLRTHRSRSMPKGVPRFRVWMVRWWQLEPEQRMALFRSAERAGGQQLIPVKRYPAKKKRSDPYLRDW